MGENRDPGSDINIPDNFSESYPFRANNTLKFFDADPGAGIFLTLDPGSWMEKFGSGINIPDPQHCVNPNHVSGFVPLWICIHLSCRIRIRIFSIKKFRKYFHKLPFFHIFPMRRTNDLTATNALNSKTKIKEIFT
jgi:hypothetical protein